MFPVLQWYRVCAGCIGVNSGQPEKIFYLRGDTAVHFIDIEIGRIDHDSIRRRQQR